MTAKHDQIRHQIVAYYMQEKNLQAVAVHFRLSRKTVASILDSEGVSRPRRKSPSQTHRQELPKDILERLYLHERMSTAAIAAELNVSAETVRNRLIEYGIDRRGNGSPLQKNYFWKSGRTIDKHGYVLVRAPGHPNATRNGYIREHRLVMSQVLGRPLSPSEVVHHKDGDKANNAPENLEIFDKNSLHLQHELKGRVPQWTESGLQRIKAGIVKKRPKWTDEHRQKMIKVRREKREARAQSCNQALPTAHSS